MIVDNFDLIKNTILPDDVENPDIFWFVQILIRHKDGHKENGNNKNRLIKFYTVKSSAELDRIKTEAIGIAKVTNARIYIHPTPRSFKDVADEMMREFALTYTSQNYPGIKGLYTTAAGKSFIRVHKLFIVDLDDDMASEENIEKIRNFLCQECDVPIKAIIPTMHGCHLICRPFNTKLFADTFPNVDIHKNNPTLLYYDNQKED